MDPQVSPSNPHVERHLKSGRFFEADGLRSFVLDQGHGEAVVLMHGVPASSYLYRKVVPRLADAGLRGIAFDLPGLGLTDRPATYDYSWTGLGQFCTRAIDALGLERFHLVVHDIGGPVGLELAAARPGQVASLTILNTLLRVAEFKKPWSMRPFGVPGLNRLWLASTRLKPVFRQLMYMQGIADRDAVPAEEVDGYIDLLHYGDGGRAFLQIMASFETTEAKSELYAATLRNAAYPIQVVWGRDDPALSMERFGRIAEAMTGTTATQLPGRHFFQDDSAEALAAALVTFVRNAG
jgi:pimeloyl-ACP methyl ester carboxylesterase